MSACVCACIHVCIIYSLYRTTRVCALMSLWEWGSLMLYCGWPHHWEEAPCLQNMCTTHSAGSQRMTRIRKSNVCESIKNDCVTPLMSGFHCVHVCASDCQWLIDVAVISHRIRLCFGPEKGGRVGYQVPPVTLIFTTVHLARGGQCLASTTGDSFTRSEERKAPDTRWKTLRWRVPQELPSVQPHPVGDC